MLSTYQYILQYVNVVNVVNGMYLANLAKEINTTELQLNPTSINKDSTKRLTIIKVALSRIYNDLVILTMQMRIY